MTKKIIAGVLSIVIMLGLGTVTLGVILSQRLKVDKFVLSINKEIAAPIKIVQISDLHYPKNGINLDKILEETQKCKPDIIALTGDIVDGSAVTEDIENVADFLAEIGKICKTYAVIGNHEIGSGHLNQYSYSLINDNIILLNNRYEQAKINDTELTIIGLKDANLLTKDNIEKWDKINGKSVKILLAHRCELFEDYRKADEEIRPDVIFAGHAHGGQVRLFNQGIYSPDQGVFPKITSGKYFADGVTMFVSRGLGDSNSDFRMFNSYNVICVTLS